MINCRRFIPKDRSYTFNPKEFKNFIFDIRKPLHLLFAENKKMIGISNEGEITSNDANGFAMLGSLPAMYPEWLGDRDFLETHNVRFAYIGGAMARGITSSKMVIELARIGMMGFLGSAGMQLTKLEEEIMLISKTLNPDGLSFGSNLIHTPNDLQLEEKIIDLYIKHHVTKISAAAFTMLTPSLVRYSCNGLRIDERGEIVRKNYIFAKISHPETAKHFLSPAPDDILQELLAAGKITDEEAHIAKRIPVSEDLDVEGDSGGHTDNRPLAVLFSTIAFLRNEISNKYAYKNKIRLGAGGGISTPQSVAGAFAMGASHIFAGSVHQACVESGTSFDVKKMLAKANLGDVLMTSSADMFEMGVKVQVLKRGTMMGLRGNFLYDLYKRYDSIDDIPENIINDIEKNIFKMPLIEVWNETKNYFNSVEPENVSIEDVSPKRKMALIFRWYLGNSSRWPIMGNSERITDYQIWCGPAMGAFNEWVKNSFLELPESRTVKQVALNLMEGGAILTRLHQLRTYGLSINEEDFIYKPEILGV